MRFTRDDYQLVLDYDEFVDGYFLQGDDDADSLRPAEDEHLRCFYTMYAEFSDESAGFDQALDEWCTTDAAYLACTGDDEACARREAIKTDALSHLSEGLGRCGQDRATVREANAIEDRLSECCSTIEAMLDEIREIRGEVDELAAAFSPASWLTEWEKNPYALDPFIDQLRQLRARPARQLAARQTRMQEEMESVKESCEQTLAARPVTRAAPAHGDGDGAGRAC